MSIQPTTTRPRVTLFVRNGTTGADAQKRRIVDRLRALADDGRLAGVEVQSWPARICAEDVWTEREARLLDTVEQFERWAEDAGVSIGPFFDTRSDVDLVTDAERSVRVLPVMAIAVYDSASVVDTVAPHALADDQYTVYDCLADLETATADIDPADTGDPTDTGRPDSLRP